MDKALGAESPFTSVEVSIGSKFSPSLLPAERDPIPPALHLLLVREKSLVSSSKAKLSAVETFICSGPSALSQEVLDRYRF